jgi:hypothetical protein
MAAINRSLEHAESKIWHGHPVWFIDGNPIVGYSKLTSGIQLLFWSGASFEENLKQVGKFKAAEARYSERGQINPDDVARWLTKSIAIQWNYKDIVKNRGVLERLK